jgi:hypothetical protein
LHVILSLSKGAGCQHCCDCKSAKRRRTKTHESHFAAPGTQTDDWLSASVFDLGISDYRRGSRFAVGCGEAMGHHATCPCVPPSRLHYACAALDYGLCKDANYQFARYAASSKP